MYAGYSIRHANPPGIRSFAYIVGASLASALPYYYSLFLTSTTVIFRSILRRQAKEQKCSYLTNASQVPTAHDTQSANLVDHGYPLVSRVYTISPVATKVVQEPQELP